MSNPESEQPFSQSVQPLAAFAPGASVVITGFLGGRKLQERLVALGLFPGQRVNICQSNGSSLVVSLNGNSLALGRGISQKILAVPGPNSCRHQDLCQCPGKGGRNNL
jgi:ferrous iron transport protein A